MPTTVLRLLLMLTMSSSAVYAETFPQLAERYFDEVYFRFQPTAGTSAGFHRYDTRLEDYSRSSIDSQVAALHRFLKQVQDFDSRDLAPETAADRELVLANIEATLLELEHVRSWEKNPDHYSSGVSSSVFTIMSRTFAPPAERLKAVIARERQMPQVFAAARANLKNPPRVYTEVAIEQLPGIVSFFEKDVPLAFQKVTDTGLLADFRASNQAVVDLLNRYQAYLKNDLLPRSQGDFRLGAENYRKKLLYEEMVETPLDQLLQIGYRNLHENQEALRRTAAKIDPKRTPQQILEDAEKDHPAPSKLLQAFRDVLGGLQDFIIQHKIITIPSPVKPILEETPPFIRALTFASMDTPGPFENVAKEAFFNVTLPGKSWSPKQVEEHMAAFNRGVIISTAIHEAYPGHYVQFLWVQNAPSKVRKLLGANTNAEGWAHYCEQVMLDEGYGDHDPKLRLGQLQDALLRNARYIVGIQMHAGRMTYEQGIDFFVKEGMQTRANGERETKRGTSDPTYLYYTLGKLEILKLREDYKKLRGDRYTLEEFHNSFMKQGFPPIKIVRRAMLGNDSPVL
ncbi:MAG: DUF885 domain-containing protein [Acidobacteriota bacterium]|nr:DUF885 domain-containing protein [Acidobacteriota bacterium]